MPDDQAVAANTAQGLAFGGVVVAVRVWLRVRAENIDVAHQDTQAYAYADRNQAALNDRIRRLVVMQTIQLRNTRT